MSFLFENQFANINDHNQYGRTALHCAAQNNKEAVVNYLIANKANINEGGEFGTTPLHLAAENGHTKIVEILLNAGADPILQDAYAQTAQDCAEREGHTETANIIKEHFHKPIPLKPAEVTKPDNTSKGAFILKRYSSLEDSAFAKRTRVESSSSQSFVV